MVHEVDLLSPDPDRNHYFTEPITNNLIITDRNNGNTTIVPELKIVRVFKANVTALMTPGSKDNELNRLSEIDPKKGARKCGNCGEVGYSARTCPGGK
jgi:hypothetical protein